MHNIRLFFYCPDLGRLRRYKDFFVNNTTYEIGIYTKLPNSHADVRPDVAVVDVSVANFNSIALFDESVIKIICISDESHRNLLCGEMYDGLVYKDAPISDIQREVVRALRERGAHVKAKASSDIKLKKMLMKIGIIPKLKGYYYLHDAVKYTISSPDRTVYLTTNLYPYIAEKYDVKPCNIERSIRHAISVADSKGKIRRINDILGMDVYTEKERPSNGELITILANILCAESEGMFRADGCLI